MRETSTTMSVEPFFIAQGTAELFFLPKMANRHGLIAGATGTGKTVTLRVLAENFSAIGVPVFMADVKGDLGGLAKPGATSPRVIERAQQLGLEIAPNGFPVAFWDVFGKSGHPVRATISEMGPLLLARLLSLNETQEGVLNVVFHIADEEGLLLIDMKDLQAMLQYVAQNAGEYTTKYGNVATATVGAIQRALLTLQKQGGDKFFGEPALDLEDFMRCAEDGRGVVNILVANELMTAPRTYAAFMLWMLSELFERLPEVGDVEKPRLVFFFDEAHLLFGELPQAMQEKIEQVVRLIRSKGVGVYFISQNPLDIPDKVLGQLGNRIQHALRAFTPRDQKAVRAAAETFRANPKLDVEAAIGELGVGEALVSLLDARGTPGIVERALIAPPVSQLEPLADEERSVLIEGCELFEKYAETVDRESAYEALQGSPNTPAPRTAPVAASGAPYDAVAAARARAAARTAGGSGAAGSALDEALGNVREGEPAGPVDAVKQRRIEQADSRLENEAEHIDVQREKVELARRRIQLEAEREKRIATGAGKPTVLEKMAQASMTSAVRSATSQIVRSILGGILGGRRR